MAVISVGGGNQVNTDNLTKEQALDFIQKLYDLPQTEVIKSSINKLVDKVKSFEETAIRESGIGNEKNAIIGLLKSPTAVSQPEMVESINSKLSLAIQKSENIGEDKALLKAQRLLSDAILTNNVSNIEPYLEQFKDKQEQINLIKSVDNLRGALDTYLEKNISGLNLSKMEATLSGDKEAVSLTSKVFANEYIPEIMKQFKTDYGRNPTRSEIEAIFNHTDFNSAIKGIDAVNIQQNPEAIKNTIEHFKTDKTTNLASVVRSFLPRINLVETARNQLSPYGADIDDSTIRQVLSTGVPIQDAERLLASYVQKEANKRVSESFEPFKEKQLGEVEKLGKSMEESDIAFFQRAIPFIKRRESARGGLRSGALEESFSQALGGLREKTGGIIGQLKYDVGTGTNRASFENLIRSQLEAGKSLSEATNFARNVFAQNIQNIYGASEAEKSRQFQSEQNRSIQAFLSALQSRTAKPSALDYFLQYGLPVVTDIAKGFIGKGA